jgi:hypothetical protein
MQEMGQGHIDQIDISILEEIVPVGMATRRWNAKPVAYQVSPLSGRIRDRDDFEAVI